MPCSKCVKIVFERARLEPKEAEKQAEYYGCQIGDIHSVNTAALA